jgi:hypothetical protein
MTAGGGGNMTAGGGGNTTAVRGHSTAVKVSRFRSRTHRQ